VARDELKSTEKTRQTYSLIKLHVEYVEFFCHMKRSYFETGAYFSFHDTHIITPPNA